MTRVLAYAVNMNTVRAIDIGADDATDLELCPLGPLLNDADALQSELNSPALLSKSTWPQLERFASGWGRDLLPAAWLASPPDRCVLIPHALLHALPLHLVRTDSGRPLCVDSAVSVSSSLTALRYALQRSTQDGTDLEDQFMTMRQEDATRTATGPLSRADLSEVPYVRTGRRFLAAGVDALGTHDDAWRRLPSQLVSAFAPHEDEAVITDPGESLRDVVAKRLVGHRYDLVVLAAHGYRNRLNALDGGLVLRSAHEPRSLLLQPVLGNYSDPDGVPYMFVDLPTRDLPPELTPSCPAELLSVAELERDRAHIDCPLVLLLGCSTGRPVVHAGDQPQSLAEIFLRIGAATAVAPMWDVRVSAISDWATHFLMRLGGRSDRGRGDASQHASQQMHDDGAALQDVGCMVVHGDYR